MRDKAGYWYKNETLIERLEITIEEQRKLKTIIGTEEKYRRKNERRKSKRRNSNGLTKKQQELADLKVKVLELKKQGLNNSEIARKLEVDRKKVSRLVNQK